MALWKTRACPTFGRLSVGESEITGKRLWEIHGAFVRCLVFAG